MDEQLTPEQLAYLLREHDTILLAIKTNDYAMLEGIVGNVGFITRFGTMTLNEAVERYTKWMEDQISDQLGKN